MLIENAPGSGDVPVAGQRPGGSRGARHRRDAPMVLYTGTFEAYQGLDLLFARGQSGASRAARRALRARGRQARSGRDARRRRRRRSAPTALIFAGERPAEAIPAYLDAADVLVSPRSTGTNTPLKIYQYLRSGRVIVATRLLTHTQVLSDEVAILTEPTPEEFCARHPAGDRRSGGRQHESAPPRSSSPRRGTPTRRTCSARAKPAPPWWRE